MNGESIDLTAITKLRHAALWELSKRLGGQAQAAEQCFVTTSIFNQWTTLKKAFPSAPTRGWWMNKERWTQTKDALESLTGQTLSQLWPQALLNVIETHQLITTVEQVIEVPEQALLAYAEETATRFRLPPPVVHIEQDELRGAIQTAMKSLSPREREVLELRYGLDGGEQRSLEDVGHIVGVSRERVRQIEARATRRLTSPNVTKNLAGFLD
jgi:RNA polymerase sigma factor (sigma-70 family)